MCGRYTLRSIPEVLAEAFRLEDVPDLQPRYNIAPSQWVACVKARPPSHGHRLDRLRWGFMPSWARDPAIGTTLINARAETVAAKPAFQKPFRERRCLVLADGYYEWKREGAGRQPYYIRLRDERPFAFAGLWDRWTGEDGTILESCAILTTEPDESMALIHHRMPVILRPAAYEPWLDPALRNATRLVTLLTPRPAETLVATPVGVRVNNPRFDDARCLES